MNRSIRWRRLALLGIVALAGRSHTATRDRRQGRLFGKRVLILGGSRGLGLNLAREFGRRGATLYLAARDPEELEVARGELEGRGVETHVGTCDVSNKEEIDNLLVAAREEMGDVDVLVNVAGVIQVGPAEVLSGEDFREAMDVNFWSQVHACYGIFPSMKGRGGSIVNITSVAGVMAVPHLLAYSASKSAVVGFSSAFGAEMDRHGIRVTTVVPGLMATGSFLHARAKGRASAEYKLFSLAASLPLLAMDARRAARKIVDACERGDRWVTVGAQARLAHLAAGLMPQLTAAGLAFVARRLPGPGGARPSQNAAPGWTLNRGPLVSFFTSRGDAAARRNNEIPVGA